MKVLPTQAVILPLLFLLLAAVARAHPIPDIPVRTFFPGDGTARVTVEVDPRCFEADPPTAPSLLKWAFEPMSAEDRRQLVEKADELVRRCIEFKLEPVGAVHPEFKFAFTGHSGEPLKADEDVVVLTGEWRTTLPAGQGGWSIRSTEKSKLSVVFQNIIRGRVHERLAVLFPGEQSFTLDLASLANAPANDGAGRVSAEGSAGDRWSTFRTYLRDGFKHVVPEGLDHILFVLGLFLLSRRWRPVMAQVTTFTLAHSVTLALATVGVVNVRPAIVEPIIAASIAFVALENIFRPRYTHWRLLVVLCFGLVHGLGFASALREKQLPANSLIVCLVGFNVGVEGGQLAVIGAAFLLTAWLRDAANYRPWIVSPGSVLIAACGASWTVQEIFLRWSPSSAQRTAVGTAATLLPIEAVNAAEDVVFGNEDVAVLVERHAVRRGDDAGTPFVGLGFVGADFVRSGVGAEFRDHLPCLVENGNLAPDLADRGIIAVDGHRCGLEHVLRDHPEEFTIQRQVDDAEILAVAANDSRRIKARIDGNFVQRLEAVGFLLAAE